MFFWYQQIQKKPIFFKIKRSLRFDIISRPNLKLTYFISILTVRQMIFSDVTSIFFNPEGFIGPVKVVLFTIER